MPKPRITVMMKRAGDKHYLGSKDISGETRIGRKMHPEGIHLPFSPIAVTGKERALQRIRKLKTEGLRNEFEGLTPEDLALYEGISRHAGTFVPTENGIRYHQVSENPSSHARLNGSEVLPGNHVDLGHGAILTFHGMNGEELAHLQVHMQKPMENK